jgi:hypothetical protein
MYVKVDKKYVGKIVYKTSIKNNDEFEAFKKCIRTAYHKTKNPIIKQFLNLPKEQQIEILKSLSVGYLFYRNCITNNYLFDVEEFVELIKNSGDVK